MDDTHETIHITHRLEQTAYHLLQQIEFSEKTRKFRKEKIEGKGYRSRKLLLSSRKALTNKKITIRLPWRGQSARAVQTRLQLRGRVVPAAAGYGTMLHTRAV
jgi:hypothetical protein